MENGDNKRSHLSTGDGSFHFKIWLPSVADGAMFRKVGEIIAHLQKDSQTRIKYSKSIIIQQQQKESIKSKVIVDKIKGNKQEIKSTLETDNGMDERYPQIKIFVPNFTPVMIIGQAGNYIKQNKEENGFYVYISEMFLYFKRILNIRKSVDALIF